MHKNIYIQNLHIISNNNIPKLNHKTLSKVINCQEINIFLVMKYYLCLFNYCHLFNCCHESFMPLSGKIFLKSIISVTVWTSPFSLIPYWIFPFEVKYVCINILSEKLLKFSPQNFVLGTQNFIDKNSCTLSKIKFARVSVFYFFLYFFLDNCQEVINCQEINKFYSQWNTTSICLTSVIYLIAFMSHLCQYLEKSF